MFSPSQPNPYMRGTLITEEYISECLKEVAVYALYPVTITPSPGK